MIKFLTILLLSILITACSGRPVTLVDGGPAAPTPSTPNTVIPQDPSCGVDVQLGPTRYFDCSTDAYFQGNYPIISGDLVIYEGSHGQEMLVKILAEDTVSGETRVLVDRSEDIYLAGAEGSTVLFFARDDHQSYRLGLSRDQGITQLGSYGLQIPFWGMDMYTAPPRQMLHRGQVAWSEVIHHPGVGIFQQMVYRHDGGEVEQISIGKDQGYPSSAAYISEGVIVWSQWDGDDTEIMRYKDGEVIQLTDDDSPDDSPVTDGELVLWRCDEGICGWRGGEIMRLDQGSCSSPDLHQGQAAWSCDNRVTLYEGGKVRRVAEGLEPDPGGDLDGAPRPPTSTSSARIRAGRVLWVESDSTQDYGGGLGKLRLYDGQRVIDVAQVGLPCMVCDAYWPPLAIALSDKLIAWSYAMAEDPASREAPYPGDGRQQCAYAEIQQTPLPCIW